ncbi:hypothetical protein [Glutamicibacter protophormiae]|uniref:Centromere-binding protein ParB C-terminal domain-containing protein n=1 Tax=Glutamicibacter protophormiae TaxID=37930 RepID=A0ABS4XMP0_GLUPR|nr:hypothetical protein [Glutamicibacter protophormiae]MBP2397665.1 hypothetical protein [Glutamicibacter protophormiae]GGL87494.1 hypothetical protein GCM10010038_16950 [Glutamicibacter protophormiae]
MPRKHLNVSVSHDEFEDLNNALEDHRDGFKRMAEDAENGFGLDPAYWAGRAYEVEGLRKSMHEHSTEEFEGDEVCSTEAEECKDSAPARDQDSMPGSQA